MAAWERARSTGTKRVCGSTWAIEEAGQWSCSLPVASSGGRSRAATAPDQVPSWIRVSQTSVRMIPWRHRPCFSPPPISESSLFGWLQSTLQAFLLPVDDALAGPRFSSGWAYGPPRMGSGNETAQSDSRLDRSRTRSAPRLLAGSPRPSFREGHHPPGRSSKSPFFSSQPFSSSRSTLRPPGWPAWSSGTRCRRATSDA
jgi:hypothetical protein